MHRRCDLLQRNPSLKKFKPQQYVIKVLLIGAEVRGCPVFDLKLLFLTRLPLTSLLSLNKGRKDTERREDTWRSPDAPWMPEEVPYKVEHF